MKQASILTTISNKIHCAIMLIVFLACMPITSNGQIKDLTELMLLTKYNESQLSKHFNSNEYEFVGESNLDGIKNPVKVWSYKDKYDNKTEGGIGYVKSISSYPVLVYLTVDASLLPTVFSQLDKYKFILDYKTEEKDNNVNYNYTNSTHYLTIKMWKHKGIRMILFMIGTPNDIKHLAA